MEREIEQLAGRVRQAAEKGERLRIRGGGTKDFYGQALEGEVLDTTALSGVVGYEPTELVVTARAGTPLAALEAVLAEQGQMLAFEPPRFGPLATLGGCVACGLSGPRRASAGAVRDFVLGVKVLDGRGEVLSFGGQVMKNVAGYDVSRLMCGALGTLGVILEVSLKVLPLPVAEETLRFAMDQAESLRWLNEWGGKPLPLSGSAWQDGALSLRLSGAAAAVQAARGWLGGEVLAPGLAQDFWAGLREHTAAFFSGPQPLWRLSVPSVAPPLALPGRQLMEWGGALRWLRSDAPAELIRAAAREAGGHATLFRGGDRNAVAVFTPLDPVQWKIHRNLKQAFDPRGILNPGRLYPDL